MILEQLTIVFQGKLHNKGAKSTEELIKSYIQYYPKVNIVISTWKGEVISSYLKENCKVVFSEDPGRVVDWQSNKPNNVNRQIVSSLNGIKIVESKYVLKLRTDCSVNLDLISKIFIKYCNNDKKVIISNLTSKNPRYVNKLYYHFCDWIYFGKTDEVIKFFDIPLFSSKLYPNSKIDVAPEQHISFSWLINKNYIKVLSDIYSLFTIRTQEKIISECLILTTPREIGLKSLKRSYRLMPFGKNGFISYTPIDIKILHKENRNIEFLLNPLYRLRHYIQYLIVQLLLKIRVLWN